VHFTESVRVTETQVVLASDAISLLWCTCLPGGCFPR